MDTDRFDARLKELFVFFTVLSAMAIPVYAVLYSGYDFGFLRVGFAHGAANILRIIGVPAGADGSVIYTGQLVVAVTRDSTAWKSLFAFGALVIATRVRARDTVTALAGGVMVLAAINLARLVSMIYLVEVHGIAFEVLHTLLWRWGLLAAVLGVWVIWLVRWTDAL